MVENTEIDKITEDELQSIFKMSDSEIENIEKDSKTTHDDIADFYKYKKHLRESAMKQINFKDNIRKKALILFLVLTVLLIINLFTMVYLQGVKIPIISYKLPNFDFKLVMFFSSVTFLNIFGLIGFLFKYIFSPTTDLLNHNKDLSS